MSSAEKQHVGATIQRLVAEPAEASLGGSRLRDPEFRRRHAVEALLHNPDPVMREIGEQVRDGTMSLRDVLRSQTYVETFLRAGEQAQERLDPRQLAEDLSGLVARAHAEQQEGDQTRRPGDEQPARADR